MSKLLTMLCLVLVFASSTFAQVESSGETVESDALVNSLNLRLLTMQLALRESGNLESGLELVEDQRTALVTLTNDYRQMVESINDLEKTEEGSSKTLPLCLSKLDSFEKRLSVDILLPHQSTALRSLVFAELVKDQGGDLITALSTYYPKQFQLEDAQETRMKEIKISTADKIKKAKQEFEKQLKQIASEAETEVRSVLTPKQSKLLTELQGKPKQSSPAK